MKLLFNVEYQTTFGESLMINFLSADDEKKVMKHKMQTLENVSRLFLLSISW